jgi:hypothetical protein
MKFTHLTFSDLIKSEKYVLDLMRLCQETNKTEIYKLYQAKRSEITTEIHYRIGIDVEG